MLFWRSMRRRVVNVARRCCQRCRLRFVLYGLGFDQMASTLLAVALEQVGPGDLVTVAFVPVDSRRLSVPIVRRFRWNSETGQVEEITLSPEVASLLSEMLVQPIRFEFTSEHRQSLQNISQIFQVMREQFSQQFALDRVMHPIIAPEPAIQPQPHPERIRLQDVFRAISLDLETLREVVDGDIYSPGEDDTRQAIADVLTDLVRENRKEDFIFMALSEAHIDEDKIEFVWNRTRRLLKLDD